MRRSDCAGCREREARGLGRTPTFGARPLQSLRAAWAEAGDIAAAESSGPRAWAAAAPPAHAAPTDRGSGNGGPGNGGFSNGGSGNRGSGNGGSGNGGSGNGGPGNGGSNHGGSEGGSGGAPDASDRRTFLRRLSIFAGALAATIIAIPAVWFVVQPLARPRQEAWRDVGALDDFAVGKTVVVQYQDPSPLNWAGVTAKTAAYVRREPNDWKAFTINCSHLGCPVRWEDDAKLFMCPCHGGVFFADGEVAAGPPEAPLARYPVRVQNGRVLIRTASVPIAGKLKP